MYKLNVPSFILFCCSSSRSGWYMIMMMCVSDVFIRCLVAKCGFGTLGPLKKKAWEMMKFGNSANAHLMIPNHRNHVIVIHTVTHINWSWFLIKTNLSVNTLHSVVSKECLPSQGISSHRFIRPSVKKAPSTPHRNRPSLYWLQVLCLHFHKAIISLRLLSVQGLFVELWAQESGHVRAPLGGQVLVHSKGRELI